MAKKPDWLKENEDGTIDVTLSRAAEFSGVKQTTLRMREPTVDDTIIGSEMDGSDAVREVATFANLTQQAPGDIRKLPMRDYLRLQVAYRTFID